MLITALVDERPWAPADVRYDAGMTTKIAVSLPDDLVMAAKRAVAEGRAGSVSAFVAKALSDRQHADSLAALVADIVSEEGAPGAEDYAWADQALGLR
jgi:Arc/MetJ-type ribon-helix-helix transcriptional regulator